MILLDYVYEIIQITTKIKPKFQSTYFVGYSSGAVVKTFYALKKYYEQ